MTVLVVSVLVAFGPPLLFEGRVISIDEPMATLTAALCMAWGGVVTICWAMYVSLKTGRATLGAIAVAVLALLFAARLVNQHMAGMIWLP
jgi:hypothetical protein